MAQVVKIRFTDYERSIATALDRIGAGERLPREGLIILKPNLTNASPPPVTTSVEAVEAVYRYCRVHTGAEIAIGEGVGSGWTEEVYAVLGYADLAKRCGLRLLDFNDGDSVEMRNPDARHLKSFHLPRIVQDAYLISIPVLKDHTFTRTTLSLKNMFGLAPSRHYGGTWNKSKLHSPSADESVVDVCLYRKPDLSIIDATMALRGGHLSGRKERLDRILAGFDPVATDAIGSRLLGHDPEALRYLKLAEGRLGTMRNIDILNA